MWWWGAVAFAQDPPPLLLQVGEETRVVALPRTDPWRQQWILHEVDRPIDREQLKLRVDRVQYLDVVDTGGGVWILSAWVDDPEVVGRWTRVPEGLRFDFTVGSPVILEIADAPTVEVLLAGEAVDPPGQPARTALVPLSGLASSTLMDPHQVDPRFPAWTPQLRPELDEATTAPARVTPYTLDRYRAALGQAANDYERAAILYRLGQAHEAIGFTREARYYFGAVTELDTSFPTLTLTLDQARVALRNGDASGARALCEEAADQARPSQHREVLTCLGLATLAGDGPAPAPTGRALAKASGRPFDLLLAGQLLLAAGHPDEAEPLLAAAASALEDPELIRLAQATQGDLHFHRAEGDPAYEAWSAAGTTGELGRVLWVRERTLQLAVGGPRTWAAALPDLSRFVPKGDRASAEALYLEAQIALALGEPIGELEALGMLMREHPRISARSDVPERLWTALDRRLRQLADQERWVELAAAWTDYYDPALVAVAQDPTSIQGVVHAHELLGLPKQALDAQRVLFGIEARQGLESPESLLVLTRLYVENGHASDALRTLDYLDELGLPKEERGRAWLLRGDAHASLEEPDQARAWWSRAAWEEGTGEAARLRMALQDAEQGRCEQALPMLEALADATLPQANDGSLHLQLARCLAEAGRTEEAAEAAREAAGRSQDEDLRRFATWLARQVSDPMVTQAIQADTDLWAAMSREDDAQSAFDAAIAARREGR